MIKRPTVAEYINAQLQVCGKSQKQVAAEVGFPKANMLTMIKQGLTKAPIPRVNALADSLGIDRAFLMRMVLNEYMPEVLEAIETALGQIKADENRQIG